MLHEYKDRIFQGIMSVESTIYIYTELGFDLSKNMTVSESVLRTVLCKRMFPRIFEAIGLAKASCVAPVWHFGASQLSALPYNFAFQESLKSREKLTPLQSLEIDCAQNMAADLENYGKVCRLARTPSA